MTATNTVKTRAWPARVTIRTTLKGEGTSETAEQSVVVPPKTEQNFHLEEGQTLSVTEIAPGDPDFPVEAAEEPASEEKPAEEKAAVDTALDANKDGHDDKTGEFVSPNKGGRKN